jgi:hypothetical protein
MDGTLVPGQTWKPDPAGSSLTRFADAPGNAAGETEAEAENMAPAAYPELRRGVARFNAAHDGGAFLGVEDVRHQRLCLSASGSRLRSTIPQTGGNTMARTTHRSSKGTKLYAVRDAEGQFKDIQTYKRAHGQDVKLVSKAETAAKKVAKRKAAKAVVKKMPAKKKTTKKAAGKK